MTVEVVRPVGRPPSPGLTRLGFATLPLLAALGPLLSVFRGLFAFRLACVFLIGYAVLFLLGRGRWRGPDLWLLLLTVSMVCAGLLGIGRIVPGSDNPYSELLAIVLGLGTALAARCWQRVVPGIYLALARGWVAAALVVCLIVVAEVATGHHLPGYLEAAAPQPAATFGNPNALAVFLVMSNVWAMAVRREPGVLWHAASWLVVAATLPVLVATNARLAAGVWLAILAWSVWSGLRRSPSSLARLGEALVPPVAIVGLLLVVPRVAGAADEVATTGSSGGVREQLTRYGLGIAFDHRGLPTWPGSFEVLIVQRADPERTGGLVNAHNVWVEILVQYGALSLVLFLGWLVACAVARTGAREDAVVAVLAILALGVIDSSLLDDASLWLFLLTLSAASRTPVPVASPSPTPVREVART